jgi:hypothetical protein
MMRAILLLFLAVFPGLLHGQVEITGQVLDAKGKRPLAFASVILADRSAGTTSDIDGKFRLVVPRFPATIKVSYMGYEPHEWVVNSKNDLPLKIFLMPAQVALKTFEFSPGLSAAERLVRRVSARRDTLDPNRLPSYTFTSYNRMVVTSEKDSIPAEVKTDPLGRIDSSEIKMKEFLESQYLFMNESVVNKRYKRPGRSYEEVVASRTSGLKNPILSALTTQLQSLSFYEDNFSVLGIEYVNPLAKAGWNLYHYEIVDTTLSDGDTIVVVSFTPLPGKTFQSMEGMLRINIAHYALESAVAIPVSEDGNRVSIRQSYKRVDSLHWFPYQLQTDLIFEGLSINGVNMKLEGRSYIRDIVINPELKGRDFGALAVEVSPDAVKKGEERLSNYRLRPLDSKDSTTYRVIDSLGDEIQLDRRLQWMQAMLSGKLRLWYFDTEIKHLMSANQYEGFRLGLGGETNERLLSWFRVGGYFAYGFKDEAFKYGGHGEFRFLRKYDMRLKGYFRRDVFESGGTDFLIEPTFSLESSYREFAAVVFDSVKTYGFQYQFKPRANLHFLLQGSHSIMDPTTPYRFMDSALVNPQYRFTELALNLRWGLGEKYLAFGFDRIALPTQKPILWFSVNQGFKSLNGEFGFTRIMAMLEENYTWKRMGKSRLVLLGGAVIGEAPYARLFNGRGTYFDFSLVARNGFETLRPNEFMNDTYAGLLMSHVFPAFFKFRKLSKPALGAVYNIGWGQLSNPERHLGMEFETMEKGLFEGGLFLQDVFILSNTGFGFGAFYRHGAYARGSFGEDLFWKAAITLTF